MSSWNDVQSAAPAVTAAVQRRFDVHGLAVMATLRRDGSPRLSGIEPLFAGGELWLGMMPGSRKVADLERDPRLALYNATIDKDVADGDAKLAGRAVPVRDEETRRRYVRLIAEGGHHVPDGCFPLFRVDVTEVCMLRAAGDHLDIRWWREGFPVQRVERR